VVTANRYAFAARWFPAGRSKRRPASQQASLCTTARSEYDGAGCQGVRFDDGIRAIVTGRGMAVGGLILDEMRAARAVGRGRLSAQLGWTLIWVIGLSALFSAAEASGA
jgi:hypothetical protein